MARRVVRQVFANAVEIRAAATHKAFPLTAHQGEDFEDFVGRVNSRIDQDFARQRYMPRLRQKSEGKTRRQTETIFLVSATLIELQLQVGNPLAARRQKREICHSSEDTRWRWNHHDPLQTAIG